MVDIKLTIEQIKRILDHKEVEITKWIGGVLTKIRIKAYSEGD